MINDLPNGEVCLAMSWSGDYGLALERAREAGIVVNLEYTAPREGALLFSDGIFITADAAHPHNAHRFLDYVMRPEVIALASDFTHYQNANLASVPFVDPEIVNNPALYAPPEVRDRLLFGKIHGPKEERQRTRAWARVKTGL
jgi:putrescine transport system substrate-binding protein